MYYDQSSKYETRPKSEHLKLVLCFYCTIILVNLELHVNVETMIHLSKHFFAPKYIQSSAEKYSEYLSSHDTR